MDAVIKTGISAWTEPTLVSSGWYPPGTNSAEGRLRYYATQFPLVELDATHYAVPSEQHARMWSERTPEGFTMNVKAFGALTAHYIDPRRLPRDLREGLPDEVRAKARAYPKDLGDAVLDELAHRLRSALGPLRESGRLGVVLFQYPVWVPASPEGRRWIERARGWFPDDRVAIEFRNATWMSSPERSEETFALLRDLDLAYTAVDEPQGFTSSVPPVAEATSRVALVRMHGRLAEAWEEPAPAARDRFRWLYTEGELGEWVPKVRSLARRAGEVHVVFNNCYADHAVRNAQKFTALLASAGAAAREAA